MKSILRTKTNLNFDLQDLYEIRKRSSSKLIEHERAPNPISGRWRPVVQRVMRVQQQLDLRSTPPTMLTRPEWDFAHGNSLNCIRRPRSAHISNREQFAATLVETALVGKTSTLRHCLASKSSEQISFVSIFANNLPSLCPFGKSSSPAL